MKTILTKSIDEAAEFIKKGGIAAFPTETVYGLGADVFNEKATEKIFKAKQRPNDNPLIAHVGSLEQIKLLVSEITPNAQRLIETFFPAPLTIVLPKAKKVPMIATANLETIGVRMPRNDLALKFLRKCGTPLAAPSANLSGKPSPTNWQAVFEDLNGKIDCILQGEISEIGLESTVVDCTSEIPLILRSGAITLEDLQKIIPETQIYKLQKDETAKSPGLKHRHYSPKAKVILMENGKWKMENEEKTAFIGLKNPNEEFELIKICDSVEDYAHSVFDFFRRCDRENIETIYCEIVEEIGIGTALMDRLKRASESSI
ncbi:MAG: L-threonylcarbamoyladenylate synthase [Acidobacteriota bacterium]|jgi:L-threonylcarbamoyladenylate synthase|nr:L-threonylcarbamoyladenylate synthase [Acidobacteriota bacterium]